MGSLYEHYDFETDEGLATTTPMESLLKRTHNLGMGTECPECGNVWKGVFFGDPDGDHRCAPCQILKDAGLDSEGNGGSNG